MDNKILPTVFFAFLLASGITFAATGKITITSPAEGAMVGSSGKIKLSYEVDPGPEVDHLHLNIDGKRVDVLRQLKGTTEIGSLAPGKHQCQHVWHDLRSPVGQACQPVLPPQGQAGSLSYGILRR